MMLDEQPKILIFDILILIIEVFLLSINRRCDIIRK